MDRCRLLVVDKYVNLGLLYKQELNDEGYEVDITHSGIKALELIKNKSYNVLILDSAMPKIDELRTLSRILKTKKDLSIIINTGLSDRTNHSMSWVADAYILKSSDLSELKGTIKKLVEKNCGRFQEKEMYIYR